MNVNTLTHARWAPTSYKWSYNPCTWVYKWVTGVITPISGVITLLKTGRGPPCGNAGRFLWDLWDQCIYLNISYTLDIQTRPEVRYLDPKQIP